MQATNSSGFDPLTQTPDGRDKPMPLGYEKTELGPTTNFVGNHMTQGAIDLVQADLDEDPAASTPLLLDDPGKVPLLISSGLANAADAGGPLNQQIEHYGWRIVRALSASAYP